MAAAGGLRSIPKGEGKMHRKPGRRQIVQMQRLLLAGGLGLLILLVIILAVSGQRRKKPLEAQPVQSSSAQGSSSASMTPEEEAYWAGCPELDVQLLTPNAHSRPQLPLTEVNGIVIHYTANPGSTAQENRDYFENLGKEESDVYVSSHFVIGLEGEIIQCIPSSEMSYASNDRNTDTLAIECCHPDETGKFTDATYTSVVELTAWLCKAFDLKPEDVIRHYDITGKDCPKYYVEHPEAWETLLTDIREQYMSLV